MSKLRSNKGMPNNSNKSKKSKKPISDKPHNEAVEYFDRGVDLINLGKYEEAIVYLDKALLLDSSNSNTYSNKGVALDRLDEYEEAIKYFDIAINKESTNTNAYIGKGTSLTKIGKLEEALICFTKALDLDSENINVNYNKVTILAKLGKLEEALIYFDKTLVLDSTNIYANINKGVALNHLGKHKEAFVYFDNALKIEPQNTYAYLGKTFNLYSLNKHGECHQWIQKHMDKNMISYRMFNMLYIFYKNNKDYEQDIEEYIQKTIAIESDKNSEGAEFYQYSPLSKEIIYNITNQEIYFSNPSNFNDPFDPLIRILNTDDSEDMLKLLNFRISCLSTNNSNILMWSHYANKHQGICIKYNIATLLKEKDIIFKKTEYIKTMPQPQSGFHLELSDTTTIIDAFTQKHDSWEYEEEYKLIVRTDENTPVLKKCDIEEIYLGKDISPEDAEFIKNTVDNKNTNDGTDIKLYQMKINEHNIFELKRHPYL